MDREYRCWTCEAVMAMVREDGVSRLYCPNCGIRKRRGRNRTDRRMQAERSGPRTKIA